MTIKHVILGCNFLMYPQMGKHERLVKLISLIIQVLELFFPKLPFRGSAKEISLIYECLNT